MGKSALNKAQTTPEALHSRQHYMHYDIAEEMFELRLPSQQIIAAELQQMLYYKSSIESVILLKS